MKRKVILILLMLIIMVVVETRGGRGGGRGGGGGGRGGSGGKGGNSGGGSHGGNRGRRPTYEQCRRNCHSKQNYHQSCVDNCVSSGGGGGMGFGGFIFLLCCCIPIMCILCCASICNRNTTPNQQQHQRNSGHYRNSSNIQLQQYNQQNQIFNSMMAKHNYPSHTTMSQHDFQLACNSFQEACNKSSTLFNFIINTDTNNVTTTANCMIVTVEPFLKKIKLIGKDDIGGSYEANGFIVCQNSGIFVWFCKIYDDRIQAGQTEEWKDLIFESISYIPSGIQGQWYYNNFQNDHEYSGKWSLKFTQNVSIQNKLYATQNDLTRPLFNNNNNYG